MEIQKDIIHSEFNTASGTPIEISVVPGVSVSSPGRKPTRPPYQGALPTVVMGSGHLQSSKQDRWDCPEAGIVNELTSDIKLQLIWTGGGGELL